MVIRSPKQNMNRSCLALVLLLMGIVLLVGAAGIVGFRYYVTATGGNPSTSSNSSAIGVSKVPDGEYIGISDGTYAFDTDRADGQLKSQGATALKNGNVASAKSLWSQGLAKDTSDAEALIYLEDQRVLASGNPYITLIVGTMLSGGASDVGTGRDNLQGAYIAQKQYNDGFKLNGSVQIRLLIANAGGQAAYATTVAEQIVQAAKQDKHIVGVMGWPFSSYALNAVSVLSKAHIPMVSPTASSDVFTGISPFFFRVAPSNKTQAIAAAQYAEQKLGATRVALFFDPNNSYTESLANDFSQQFVADRNQIVITEKYTVGKPETLQTLLNDAVNHNPDLIYFAGYADDMAVLLTDLGTSYPNLKLMGGDALYELNGYPSSARAGFKRLHFTAFAYPDEWDDLGLTAQKPAFFTIYAQAYDPNNQHRNTGNPYGYVRADNDVILSYDAMLVLLQGSNNALSGGHTSFTPDALRQGLTQITSSRPIQGVSGQIAFGSNGDPVSKAVVILYVDPNGFIKLNGVHGCFQVGQSQC